MLQPSKCRDCKADVFFAPHSLSGFNMIFNALPDPQGKWVMRNGRAVYVRDGVFEVAAGEERFTDHHATCPDREKWKRKPRKRT